MNIRFCLTVAICGLVALGDQSFGADDWIGKRIIPKSSQLQFRSENQTADNVFAIEWPAVVRKTDGLWLFVSDSGGVRQRPASGWVRSSEVLLLTDAFEYFNRQIPSEPMEGSLYWLRGICWENTHEFAMAAKDYSEALNKFPGNPDARLGLARVLGKSKYDDTKFHEAWQADQYSPRVYVHWGQGLETANQLEEAEKKYLQAQRMAPEWQVPHYRLGHLAATREKHLQAIGHFEEAIRRDHTYYVAHRDRAVSMLHLEASPAAKSQALVSARRACELCCYREAESVSALAQAYAAHEQWASARRFQQVAVEYAPLGMKAKHKQRWKEFAQKDYQQQTLLAETSRDFGAESDTRTGANDADRTSVTPLRIPNFVDRSLQSFE